MDEFSWWYETMKYIREVPGKIYKDQLFLYVKNKLLENEVENININSDEDIVGFLNSNTPDNIYRIYLIEDSITGGVFTVPVNRKFLDKMIKEYASSYDYNEYLYLDTTKDFQNQVDYNNQDTKSFPIKIEYSFSSEDWQSSIWFKNIFKLRDNVAILDFSNFNGIIKDFDLDKIYEYCLSQNIDERKFTFSYFDAHNVIFRGDTRICIDSSRDSSVRFLKGMCFKGATFEGKLVISNVNFDFKETQDMSLSNYEINKIDFRNTRFFDGIAIKNVRFISNIPDVEISFEDARISKGLELIDVELGHTKLNCFQVAVGNYISYIPEKSLEKYSYNHYIKLINVDFDEDSEIDFDDAELNNVKISFENIDGLPNTNLNFSPIKINKTPGSNDNSTDIICPYNKLTIHNCNINNTIFISNVSELSFPNTRNYGKIISGSEWGEFSDSYINKYKRKSKGFVPTKINNPLLLAAYNYTAEDESTEFDINCNKAIDFVILKEAFQADGRYDDVDEAFILYMEYKPYYDGSLNGNRHRNIRKTVLYKLLYETGKYGISPGRVFASIISLAIIFTLIYLLIDFTNWGAIYSFDGVFTADEIGPNGNFFIRLLAAFLYSTANILPFTSEFGPLNILVCIASGFESFFGTFLIGYFSVAVVRRTLH